MPSIGAAEAGFVRIGILGKPSLIYDICHPRALKLSVMALRRAGDSVLFSNQVHADINFYGKINVSLEDVDSKNANETDFQNNASRIGVKGSYNFSPGIKLSFQIEEEIDPTDLRADGDKVFKERNTFIAISGSLGKLYTGTHDTAFKKSQLKIDLFNDT